MRGGALLLAAGAVLSGAVLAVDAPAEKAPTVRLIVDYGDGVEKHFTALPFKKGMTVLAEKVASEYVRLLDEGWTPDVDEFLGRVPEEHRDACREIIVKMTSEQGPRRLTKTEAMAMFREMAEGA